MNAAEVELAPFPANVPAEGGQHSCRWCVDAQAVNQKLQPHMQTISEAKARQSEPAAERDLLAQRHAAALKAFQVQLAGQPAPPETCRTCVPWPCAQDVLLRHDCQTSPLCAVLFQPVTIWVLLHLGR